MKLHVLIVDPKRKEWDNHIGYVCLPYILMIKSFTYLLILKEPKKQRGSDKASLPHPSPSRSESCILSVLKSLLQLIKDRALADVMKARSKERVW
jgi:hypothetical protein